MEEKFKPGMLYYIPADKIETAAPKPIMVKDVCPAIIEPGEWKPTPILLSGTVKISKKEGKKIRRMWFKKERIPRKLKKAFKHIWVNNDDMKIDTESTPDDVVMTFGYTIGTKGGYPKTKWVRKAFVLFYKSTKRSIDRLEQMLRESCPDRGSEIVLTKEERERLKAVMTMPEDGDGIAM